MVVGLGVVLVGGEHFFFFVGCSRCRFLYSFLLRGTHQRQKILKKKKKDSAERCADIVVMDLTMDNWNYVVIPNHKHVHLSSL